MTEACDRTLSGVSAEECDGFFWRKAIAAGSSILFPVNTFVGVEFAGASVSAASESHIDIAEVRKDGGVGLDFQCSEQIYTRLIKPVLLGINDCEVVICLVNVGVIAQESFEDGDSLVPPSFVYPEKAVQQTCAGMERLTPEHGFKNSPRFRIAILGDKRKSALQGIVS